MRPAMAAKRSPRGRKPRKPIMAWAVVHRALSCPLRAFTDRYAAEYWAMTSCVPGLVTVVKLVEARPRKRKARKAGRKTK